MLCPMPAVHLPDDLRKQLKMSESGTIDNTNGPGVAVYFASDRRVRADMYIGLELDGFKRYQNISSINSTIKMQFSLHPVVLCQSDILTFNPNKDDNIVIKVCLS